MRLPLAVNCMRRHQLGPSSSATAPVPVVVAVKEITTLLGSSKQVESAVTP
jgi:hypothetical protein